MPQSTPFQSVLRGADFPNRRAPGHLALTTDPIARAGTSLPDLSGLRRGPIRFSRDQAIICEGQPAKYICSVLQGTVRCCRTRYGGERNIIGFYWPGELFGLSPLGFYDVTAEAVLDDTRVIFIKRDTLEGIAKENVVVANLLRAAFMDELRRSKEYSAILNKRAKARVSGFLLDIAARWSSEQIALPMSRQEIADHLGLTVETISRMLTVLERSNMISRCGQRGIAIRSRTSMRQLCR